MAGQGANADLDARERVAHLNGRVEALEAQATRLEEALSDLRSQQRADHAEVMRALADWRLDLDAKVSDLRQTVQAHESEVSGARRERLEVIKKLGLAAAAASALVALGWIGSADAGVDPAHPPRDFEAVIKREKLEVHGD